MTTQEIFKIVGLSVLIYWMFMLTWNMIHLICEHIDPKKNKEIDLDKKGKKMLSWINSKEFFARPTITRNPYKESKLYKKAYALGIINFVILTINIVCLIACLIFCLFDYSGIFFKIVLYTIFINMALVMFLYTTIYEIEKFKSIKREKKDGMKFK